MKSKIILTAEADLEDTELREAFTKLLTKVDTLNERTKRQTIQIRELQKSKK